VIRCTEQRGAAAGEPRPQVHEAGVPFTQRGDVGLPAAEGAARPPGAALLAWLGELAAGSVTYRGLPESVMAALRDEESQLHASCAGMRAAGGRLLQRAQEAGEVRADVTAGQVLALAAGLAWAGEQSAEPAGMIRQLLSIAGRGLTV
jgi:hypothetical protein